MGTVCINSLRRITLPWRHTVLPLPGDLDKSIYFIFIIYCTVIQVCSRSSIGLCFLPEFSDNVFQNLPCLSIRTVPGPPPTSRVITTMSRETRTIRPLELSCTVRIKHTKHHHTLRLCSGVICATDFPACCRAFKWISICRRSMSTPELATEGHSSCRWHISPYNLYRPSVGEPHGVIWQLSRPEVVPRATLPHDCNEQTRRTRDLRTT